MQSVKDESQIIYTNFTFKKYKMKYVCIFFLLFTNSLFSQDSILVKERIVTATKLNVRITPSTKAKTIAQLSFGDKVEVQNILNETYAGSFELNNNLESLWAKIKFQNKVGYVALCYLSQPIELGQYGVYPNIKFPYWYKIIKTPKGDMLKNIKVRIDTIAGEYGEDDRYCVVEKGKRFFDNNNFAFLLASFNKFKEGKIGEYYSDCYIDEDQEERCPQSKSNYTFEKGTMFNECKIEIQKDSLFFINNNSKQFLFAKPYCYSRLIWYGDFDMDKKPDFILETSGNRFVFLSSKAEKGEMVGLASHFSYCECD